MFGLFGKLSSSETCETVLLISQAAKSKLPMPEAIRLSLGDGIGTCSKKVRSSLLILAELLEKGLTPKEAIPLTGLPEDVSKLLEMASESENFSETFSELTHLEVAQNTTTRSVISSLTYPLVLTAATILLLLALGVFVIPQFTSIFDDFGLNLPFMTQLFVQLSILMTQPSLYLGIFVALVLIGVMSRLIMPRFFFYIPVFGGIWRNMYSGWVLRFIATMILQNVPLPEALLRCSRKFRNQAYRNDCLEASMDAEQGMSFAEIALRYFWIFPPWIAPMLALAESPAVVAKVLRRASDAVDSHGSTGLFFLKTVFLPAFLILIMYVVALTAIAMYMPMISLITDLSSPGK